MQAEYSSEAIAIKLDVTPGPGYEGDKRGFDLVRRAIVELIERFDTGLLEKEEGYTEVLYFYASVLSASARHYMEHDPADRHLTVQRALEEMIDILVTAGMLQEQI